MAKIALMTKKANKQRARAMVVGDVVPDYLLQDNEDGSFTIFGIDSAGAQVSIANVATLAATTNEPSIYTVDPPVGVNIAGHGLLPGSAIVTVIATWNDSSVGPFTITIPVTVSGSQAVGLTVRLGTPTIRG